MKWKQTLLRILFDTAVIAIYQRFFEQFFYEEASSYVEMLRGFSNVSFVS